MKKLLLASSVFILSALPVLAGDTAAAPAAEKKGSPFGPFILIGGIFAIMYFLMIRPQQKKQKEKMAMLNSVEEGDKIVTIGGIHGKVIEIADATITIEVEGQSRLKLNKDAVNPAGEPTQMAQQK